MMRRFFLLILATTSAFAALPDYGQLLKSAEKSGVTFGLEWHGKQDYKLANENVMVPASVTKVLTAYRALKKLGPQFQFETKVSWEAAPTADHGVVQNLVVTGEGDPTWGLNELNEDEMTRVRLIAKDLKKSGIKEVRGEIKFEAADAKWNNFKYTPGWTMTDRTACYGALPGAFVIQRNCAGFVVYANKTGAWVEHGVPTKVRFNVSSGTKTALSIAPDGDMNAKSYVVTGTIAKTAKKGSQVELFIVPVLESTAWAKNLFAKALKENGIKVDEKAPSNVANESARDEKIFKSPYLYEITRPMLKNSINVVAEALYQRAGAEEYVEKGFHIIDGSGLSRLDRMTPAALYGLLQEIQKSEVFTYVFDGLPIAGRDGTLASRMNGSAAEGVLRAKTGTVNGVSNLAGFIPVKNKSGAIETIYPFVIMSAFENNGLVQLSRGTQNKVGNAMTKEVLYSAAK